MRADIVHAGGSEDPGDTVSGHWEYTQDESGEITQTWVPDEAVPDDTDYVYNKTIPCIARGYVGTGLQAAGTSEQWGEIYESTDTIRLWFPSNILLTKNDKVTNVRGPNGIIWREEELNTGDPNTPAAPTIFNVKGVVPLIDPFGNHVESYALCERAEIQDAS